jgi:hypothetical protein
MCYQAGWYSSNTHALHSGGVHFEYWLICQIAQIFVVFHSSYAHIFYI